jgi:hypothetical protein
MVLQTNLLGAKLPPRNLPPRNRALWKRALWKRALLNRALWRRGRRSFFLRLVACLRKDHH